MPDAGDIVWLQFAGAVQTKRRPAVVLSSPTYHTTRPDVIIGLITSQISKANAPSDHVLTDWNSAGLNKPSAFRAFITTVPKAAIISTVGKLSSTDWHAVKKCINSAIVFV
jgi:mRNA interferase MazF